MPSTEAAVERAATAFPEVDLEQLGTIYERFDGEPSLADVAAVLERAADLGKVPDADYQTRVDGAPDAEPTLHPEFAEALEREGLDPEAAEAGLAAEQAAAERDWAGLADRAAAGDAEAVVDAYVDVQGSIEAVLKSPTRTDIPDDMEAAAIALAGELEARVERAGREADADELAALHEQLQRLPVGDLRGSLVDSLRPWRRLAANDGTEADAAREWVLEAPDAATVADRLQTVRAGERFDVDNRQVWAIAEAARERVAGGG